MSETNLIQVSNHYANRIDCIQGAGGNSSIKLPDGTMLIKSSGKLLKEVATENAYTKVNVPKINAILKDENFDVTHPESIAQLDTIVKASVIDSSGLRPSMETSFHCLYANAVLHTHDVYANIFLCSSHAHLLENCFNGNENYTISLLENYYTPGSELSWHIYDSYRFSEAMPNVTFLPNHGIIFSHVTVAALLAMADDVQQKITAFLKLDTNAYPTYEASLQNGKIMVQCNFLFQVWKKIAWQTIITDLLFPDQAIYIYPNTISTTDSDAKIYLDFANNNILCSCSYREADGILETIIAYFFMRNQMHINEYEPLTINWEMEKLRNMGSEQYRKKQIQ
jgi:ribulose-5-phosphate 4-epimerase/fuculose-1-phosphate aldolase